jgi:REP element-mobilizing transposase RayT
MARPLRIEYDGAFYHVTARGNERRKIFFSKSDYLRFKDNLREAQQKYGYLLHSFVLMTNHYHLLIETPKANLAKVMHDVNGSYSGYVNRKRKRSGHLFQGRYKVIVVERDRYLLELSRYIHLNPVRAGVVVRPEDYSYSSYRSFISKEKEGIVCHDLVLGMISNHPKDAPKRYRSFVEGAIGEDLDDPLEDVYGGMILGCAGFIKEALGHLKDAVLYQEEIAHGRELRSALRMDDILMALSGYLDIPRKQLLEKESEHRSMAIYLLKTHTGLTNSQIGQMCGGLSYSAISKSYQRFSAKLRTDRELRKGIKAVLSHVKA